MKKSILFFLLGMVIFGMGACKKDKDNGPNDLGGETDIPLTQVGSES